MVGVNGWLVGRRPSDSTPSLSLSHPSSSVATRRKSLRLTGSHGITGTRDIYASASTDRSITRNKEIANLLQEPSATPSGSSTLSAPSCPPPTFFLFFDIVRRRVEGGPVRELFRLLWVETAMGHPATFQMMGKKSCDKSGWWGVAKEERNWLFELFGYHEIHIIPFELL